MLRVQDGFEENDLNGWNVSSASTGWTSAVAAAAARTGTYGYRASRGAVASGAGAYIENQIGASTKLWVNISGAAARALKAVGGNNIWAKRFYYRNDLGAGNKTGFGTIVKPFAFRSSTAEWASILITHNASNDNKVTLQSTAGTTQQQVAGNMTANTWYRVIIAIVLDANGDGWVSLWFYPTNSNIAVLSAATKIAVGANTIDRYRMGAEVVGFQAGAQNHDFDDVRLNDDEVIGSGINVGIHNLGGGATLAVNRPSAAGSATNWTRGGTDTGANYSQTNEAVSDDATTYVYFPAGAGNLADRYTMPNYGGANVVKSVVVRCRHQQHTVGGVVDVFFNAGLYDGANNLDGALNGVGNVWTYDHKVIDEISGGGPLTNAWFNACEFSIRKTQDSGGGNDKEVTQLCAWAEDTDGLTWNDGKHKDAEILQAVRRASVI